MKNTCQLIFFAISCFALPVTSQSQERPNSDKPISTTEFLQQRDVAPFCGEAHWLELVYFKHAKNSEIQELMRSDDEWISVTAKWWAIREKIERTKNTLDKERRKLEMEFFLGYFEGRTRLKIPERMKLHFRNSVLERGRISFQAIGKIANDKVSLFVRNDHLRYEADAISNWKRGSLRCNDTRTKQQLWESKLVGLGESSVMFGLPPSILWAEIEHDEQKQVVYYWSVTSGGAFVLKFDAKSGLQLGAVRMTCATAG